MDRGATLTVDEMLRDLRSVKLRGDERFRVNRVRDQFQRTGAISQTDDRWLHGACRRYHEQLEELHAARERAHRSNALRGLGLTRAEAAARVQERVQVDEAARSDLGF